VGPGGPAATPATVKALAGNFHSLPEQSQYNLLSTNWYRIASPALEPVVRALAKGSSPLRDAALARLMDLNPEAARRITLDEFAKRIFRAISITATASC